MLLLSKYYQQFNLLYIDCNCPLQGNITRIISADILGINLVYHFMIKKLTPKHAAICKCLVFCVNQLVVIPFPLHIHWTIVTRNVTKYCHHFRVDSSGSQLANWLIDNKIIDHIFGPNLHVEVQGSLVFSKQCCI